MRQGGLILAAVRVRSKKTKQKKHEIPPHPKHIRLKMQLFSAGTPYGHSKLWQHEKAICPTCRVCNRQSSHAPPRRDGRGQNTCLDISLAGVARNALSREQWRLVLSKLDKLLTLESSRIEAALAVGYFADQLTP